MATAETSPAPQPLYRHPLKLPAGSVRATLVLMIIAPFWISLLLPQFSTPMPLYLYFLVALVLVFFAAHGSSISPTGTNQPNPFYLPSGTLRLVILGGSVALLAWMLYAHPERLKDRLTPPNEPLWPYMLLVLVASYFLGSMMSSAFRSWRDKPWVQDFQAWVSLIAMGCLLIDFLIKFLIEPKLSEPLQLFTFECILTGIVAWYFGVRS